MSGEEIMAIAEAACAHVNDNDRDDLQQQVAEILWIKYKHCLSVDLALAQRICKLYQERMRRERSHGAGMIYDDDRQTTIDAEVDAREQLRNTIELRTRLGRTPHRTTIWRWKQRNV